MRDLRRLATFAGGAVLALGALSLAHAQTESPKEAAVYATADLAKAEAKLLGAGSTWSYQTIIRPEGMKYEYEVHDTRNDVIIVQEGKSNAEVGGVVTGNRVTAPGEHRGGTATGMRSIPIGPGDVLYIPAGMPHLVAPAPGSPRLRFLVVKTQP